MITQLIAYLSTKRPSQEEGHMLIEEHCKWRRSWRIWGFFTYAVHSIPNPANLTRWHTAECYMLKAWRCAKHCKNDRFPRKMFELVWRGIHCLSNRITESIKRQTLGFLSCWYESDPMNITSIFTHEYHFVTFNSSTTFSAGKRSIPTSGIKQK